MKKRIIASLLSVVLLLPLLPSAHATSKNGLQYFVKTKEHIQFSDVSKSSWYAASVEKAYELGLVAGISETSFSPDDEITIAQAIAFASRLHIIYQTGKDTLVQGNPWYQVYVEYAIKNRIISSSDFSDYNKTATRSEFAYILANVLLASTIQISPTYKLIFV